MIELNPDCRPDIRIVGHERTPIVVLDDPILSVDALVKHASQTAEYSSGDEFAYPGIRAKLPIDYSEVLVPNIVGMLDHVYRIPPGRTHKLIHELFSLITLEPEELAPLQRIPHTDTRHPFYFASVHYLSPGEHAGTGFFRHRPTGFERISEERYPELVQAANVHMEKHGLPAEKYIDASDDHFELIADVEYRQNRMIVYPGNLLHSGLIRPDVDIGADPSDGRLTANLFLYFP